MKQLNDHAIDIAAPSVLIVEDEALVRFATADLLRIEGFIVLEAATADDALDLLAAEKSVDIIFTAVHISGEISGLELVRHVAQQFPQIPVVLTSANETSEGFDLPFLPKPYRDDDVVAVLRSALGNRSGSGDDTG